MPRVAGPIGFAFCFLVTLAGRATAQETVNFHRDIRPILSNNCFQCHGPDEKQRKADLRLDTEDGAFGSLGDHAAIMRGKPEESAIIERITGKEAGKLMPPKKTGKKLSLQEIELL